MEIQQEVTNIFRTNEEKQESSNNSRVRGQVKWFNSKKGFGFITYQNDGKDDDIFVHHTCIKYSNTESFRNLISGEYVEFEVFPCPGKQGQFQAEQVTGINNGLLLSEVRNNNRTKLPLDINSKSRNMKK